MNYFGANPQPSWSTGGYGGSYDAYNRLRPQQGLEPSGSYGPPMVSPDPLPFAQQIEQQLAIVDFCFPGFTPLDTQLKTLAYQSFQFEPESPQDMQIQSQMMALTQGLPEYQEPLRLTFNALKRAKLANVTGSLYTIMANLDPSSPASSEIQNRVALIQQLDQSLAYEQQTSAQNIMQMRMPPFYA